MSAVVIAWPFADAQPVKQEGRRGRNPKSIPSIWQERRARSATRRAVELRAQLEYVRQAERENWAVLKGTFDEEIALGRRVRDLNAVNADLVKREAALVAELQALGVHVLTRRQQLGLDPSLLLAPKGGAE